MIKLNLNSKYSTVKFVYLIQTQGTRIYSLRIILPTSYPDSFHWRKKSSIPHHYVSEMSLGTRLSFSARLDVTAGEFTYQSYKCVQETGNPVYAFSKHLVYLHNEYNLINIIKNRIEIHSNRPEKIFFFQDIVISLFSFQTAQYFTNKIRNCIFQVDVRLKWLYFRYQTYFLWCTTGLFLDLFYFCYIVMTYQIALIN